VSRFEQSGVLGTGRELRLEIGGLGAGELAAQALDSCTAEELAISGVDSRGLRPAALVTLAERVRTTPANKTPNIILTAAH